MAPLRLCVCVLAVAAVAGATAVTKESLAELAGERAVYIKFCCILFLGRGIVV